MPKLATGPAAHIVRVVKVLFTASHDFFKGKNKGEKYRPFSRNTAFLAQRQAPATYLSAAVHIDEKISHMYPSFVPLTADGRLSAKVIVGNRQRLTQRQDAFWAHMIKSTRSWSAGRVPARQAAPTFHPTASSIPHLNRQLDKILQLLANNNVWNAKKRPPAGNGAAIFFPEMEYFLTQTKMYEKAIWGLSAEKERLKQELN